MISFLSSIQPTFDKIVAQLNLILQGALLTFVILYSCYQLSILCTAIIIGNFYVLHRKIFIFSKILKEKSDEVYELKADLKNSVIQGDIKDMERKQQIQNGY